MKIEEVVNLYEFLANCGLLGNIGIWLTLTFLMAVVAIWGKDKFKIDARTSKRKIFFMIGGVNLIIFVIFNIEAHQRQCILVNANCVKSEFVMYGWKVASNTTILDSSFHCKCDLDDIEAILSYHPSEFIKVKTDDDEDGIRIIDGIALAAINVYNHEHSPFIKSRILDYMETTGKNVMSYHEIRDSINGDFDDEWIEIMLSRYDSVFVPYNTLSEAKYSDSHYVKLRPRKSPKAKLANLKKEK